MKTASRTLVKSQPELWGMIDQHGRMQGLMCALVGRATEVTVSEREPESVLCWEAAGTEDRAWIKVELAEKGWGTRVEVSAENPSEPVKLEGWLDAVLEELATPEKRPFEGMNEPPSETVEEAVKDFSAVVEKPVETPLVDEAPEPAPAVQEAPPERPKKKRRRFFGL
jgi:hypothetical protein